MSAAAGVIPRTPSRVCPPPIASLARDDRMGALGTLIQLRAKEKADLAVGFAAWRRGCPPNQYPPPFIHVQILFTGQRISGQLVCTCPLTAAGIQRSVWDAMWYVQMYHYYANCNGGEDHGLR